jgi:hypothetical protein
MNDDHLDLPKRPSGLTISTNSGNEVALSEQQLDQVVNGVVQAAADLGSIAKDLVEIAKIRTAADAASKIMRERAAAAMVEAKAEVERLCASGVLARDRGSATVQVIGAINAGIALIPECDYASRHSLIEQMGGIVSEVCKDI